MQLTVFDEQAEDDSEDLKTRLDDIRIEMEYPFTEILTFPTYDFCDEIKHYSS